MGAHFQITISRRSQLCTWFFACVEECRYSRRHLLARPSHLMLSHPTQLTMSRLRFKTRRVFPQISNVSFLPESSWRMGAHFQITISRRSQLCTWFFACVEECRYSSRHLLARPSPLMLSHPTRLTMSRPSPLML